MIADQVTANHRHADLTPREVALVEFAVKLTREPAKVDAADLEALTAHGLSDADVWAGNAGPLTAREAIRYSVAHGGSPRPRARAHQLR